MSWMAPDARSSLSFTGLIFGRRLMPETFDWNPQLRRKGNGCKIDSDARLSREFQSSKGRSQATKVDLRLVAEIEDADGRANGGNLGC
jgi:hypothetical protein